MRTALLCFALVVAYTEESASLRGPSSISAIHIDPTQVPAPWLTLVPSSLASEPDMPPVTRCIAAVWRGLAATDGRVPLPKALEPPPASMLYLQSWRPFDTADQPAHPHAHRIVDNHLCFETSQPNPQIWLHLLDQIPPVHGPPEQIGTLSGWQSDGRLIARSGTHIVLGHTDLRKMAEDIRARLQRPSQALAFRVALGPWLRGLQAHADLLPKWRPLAWAFEAGIQLEHVALQGGSSFVGDRWQSRTELTGFDCATWPALTEAFMRRMPPHRQGCQIAIAFHPAKALQSTLLSLYPQDFADCNSQRAISACMYRLARERFGLHLSTLYSGWSGEVMAHIDFSAPEAAFEVALGIANPHSAQACITALAKALDITPEADDADNRRWRLTAGQEQLSLILEDDLLILTNDASISQPLRTQKTTKPAGVGALMYCRAAPGTCVKRLLPLVREHLACGERNLTAPSIGPVRGLIGLISGRLPADDRHRKTSCLIGPRLTSLLRSRRLARFLGFPDDLSATLDRSLAVYASPPNQSGDDRETVLVFRTEEGFHLVYRRYDTDVIPCAMSLDQAQIELADFDQASAVSIAGLTPIPLPEPIRIDDTVLAAAHTLLTHLPDTYEATVHADQRTLVWQESGLPLASLAGMGLVLALPAEVRRNHFEQAIMRDVRFQENMRAEYARFVPFFQAAAASHREMVRAGRPPAKPSDYILKGGISLQAAAPLFTGMSPADPTAIDTIGTFAQAASSDDAVWEVCVEPGLCITITSAGLLRFARSGHANVDIPVRRAPDRVQDF